MLNNTTLWQVGAVSGALAVCLGAFGAHGLRHRLTDERLLKAFETGAHYHLIHSLAILACTSVKTPHSSIAGGFFISGITLFSGSLYAMGYTENRSLGAITPLGGLCFIGGWITLALSRFPK